MEQEIQYEKSIVFDDNYYTDGWKIKKLTPAVADFGVYLFGGTK